MDIKLMCLGNEISVGMAEAQKDIESDFNSVFAGDVRFENYGSEKEFIASLPFPLTKAQQRCVEEIFRGNVP